MFALTLPSVCPANGTSRTVAPSAYPPPPAVDADMFDRPSVDEPRRKARRRKMPPAADLPEPEPELVYCVIYVRFSSKAQKATSVERQIELCEAYARSRGWIVLRIYEDRARTGTVLFGRTGLGQLLNDAKARRFTWVIVELADRLSRDEADMAAILKKLRRENVVVHDLSMGALEGLKRGVSGYMAEHVRNHFLSRSADGRMRAVKAGRVPHRCAYGYSLHPTLPGVRLIHKDRAEVVRRIYADFLGGATMTEIARALTGVQPTPGDVSGMQTARLPPGQMSKWSAGAIRQILRSPIYAGVLVDGMSKNKRDEITFDLICREPRPRSEWRVEDVPATCIVPVADWTRVQAKINSNCPVLHRSRAAWSKYLFTGLVICEGCGRPARTTHGAALTFRCSRD